MEHAGPGRAFSEHELAAFRGFAAKHFQKTQTDFAEAQRGRKLTLARAEHFRCSALAAKLFERLGDPQLSASARQALWTELGEPDPARPEIGQPALRAAAHRAAERRARPRARKSTPDSRALTAEQAAVQLHLAENIPAKALAPRFGVTPETIRLWVRKHRERQGSYTRAHRASAPDSTKAEAARLAIAGSHTVAQLAEKYGYHPTTVARWVREHRAAAGIPKQRRPRIPDQVRLDTLRLVFEEGLPPTVAARMSGISSNTAHLWASRHAAEHGAKIPKYDRGKRHSYPPELKAEAVRLVFAEGRRVSQAAAALSIPVATARAWAQEHQRETGEAMPGLAPISKEVREQASRAHHDLGVPIHEIAKQLHVLPRTVKTWTCFYPPGAEAPPAPSQERRRSS